MGMILIYNIRVLVKYYITVLTVKLNFKMIKNYLIKIKNQMMHNLDLVLLQ